MIHAAGLSRRDSLRVIGVGVLAGAALTMLSGCSSDAPSAGSPSKAAVRWANWPAYVDATSLGAFQQETGIPVDQLEVINDMESFVASIAPQLASGLATGYDVITLDATQIRKFADRGHLTEFDPELSAKLRDRILPQFVEAWDTDFRYHCPYASGAFSIGYNQRRTGRPVTRTADLLDPAFKGHVGLWSGYTETYSLFAMVLRERGEITNPPDAITVDDVRKTHALLMPYAQSGQFRITGSDYLQGLASGDLWAAFATAVDVRTLADPDIGFSYAKEGSLQILDSLVIPVGSQPTSNVTEFIGYWAQPEVGARLMIEMGFQPTLKGEAEAAALLDPSIVSDPAVVPPAEVVPTIHQYPNWSESDDAEIAGMWAELTGR